MFSKNYMVTSRSLQVFIISGLLLIQAGARAGREAYPSGVVEHAAPATQSGPTANYPPDPHREIPDAYDITNLATLQTTFNNARQQENSQLGTKIPMLTVPSQAEWDAMSNGEKALWLINRERLDRGVPALHGVEPNVTSVAQTYAEYLLSHDRFGHEADGRNPWERLAANAAIGACQDTLSISENLGMLGSSANHFPMALEQIIYGWMYQDASDGNNWGHRHALLWYPYEENSGRTDREGFLGIGLATGSSYQLPGYPSIPYAVVVVMNVFDPCANWKYNTEPTIGDKLTFLALIRR